MSEEMWRIERLGLDAVELRSDVPLVELRFAKQRRNAWTASEVARLRELFAAEMPAVEIARLLERPVAGVETKLLSLGLRRPQPPSWTAEQDEIVTRRYPTETAAAIAADLNRSPASVYARAHHLGLTHRQPPDWTEWELEKLRAGYADGTPIIIVAALIGRTISAVMTKAAAENLAHANARAGWSDAEDAVLHAAVTDGLTTREMVSRLAVAGFTRSFLAIKQRVTALGYDRTFGRPWTAEEDEALRKACRSGELLSIVAGRLNRGRSGCLYRIRHLGLRHARPNGARKGRAWEAHEHEVLRAGYAAGRKPAEIARDLNRPLGAVYTEANRLKLTGVLRKRFSPADIEALRQAAADGKTLKAAAADLGRDYQTTCRVAAKHRIVFANSKVARLAPPSAAPTNDNAVGIAPPAAEARRA